MPSKKRKGSVFQSHHFSGDNSLVELRGCKKSSMSFSLTLNLNEPQRNQVTNLFVCLFVCYDFFRDFQYLEKSGSIWTYFHAEAIESKAICKGN